MTAKERKLNEQKRLEKIDDYSQRLEAIMNKTRSLGILSNENESKINNTLDDLDVLKERVLSESRCEIEFVKRPTESSFNEIKEAASQIDQSFELNGFYPTVEMLKAYKIDKKVSKFLHIIMFFSTDPYTRFDDPIKDEKDYQETVKYCQELLETVELRA